MASRKASASPKSSPKSQKAKEQATIDEDVMSEEEKKMTLEERLMVIDREIRTLHEFCVNKGYNPWQVESSARPLFDLVSEHRRKTWLVRACKLSAFVAFVAVLFYIDPVYRLMCSYGRRASIQVLPYWDWSRLYNDECLVDNPYFRGSQLTQEDCEVCETLEEIFRISNISHAVMAEDYLKRDTPVIITDAIDDWEAEHLFSVHFLHELYNQHEEALKEAISCMFASNVRIRLGNCRTLLRKAAKGEISNWYGHWENCDKYAAKVMRQFYRRPYFVPPMVEMGETNWIFVASHYKAKLPKNADIAMPMIIFAQLKGETKVVLTPRSPCGGTCPKLYATVHPGEILVFTDLMWTLDYMHLGSPETIAIGMGGYFD